MPKQGKGEYTGAGMIEETPAELGFTPMPELIPLNIPHVDHGHVVLPAEAVNFLSSARNELSVHRHLEELKATDPDTYNHSQNVAIKTLALVWMNRKLEGITDKDITAICRASLLHDMGKLDLGRVAQVDAETGEETGESVLLHQVNRRFNPEERAQASRHAMLSIARLQSHHHVDDPLTLGLITLHHQIQKNPMLTKEDAEAVLDDLGLGEEQKQKAYMYAQMMEVSDKFDAKTTNRPDEAAASPEEVRDYLYKHFEERGGDLRYVYQIISLHYPGLGQGSVS